MIEVKAFFHAGPLDGQVALTTGLDQVKVFFEERQRQVMLYVHQGDGEYLFSLNLSKALTDKYDEALAKFGAGGPTLRFPDVQPYPMMEIEPERIFNFDEPITPEPDLEPEFKPVDYTFLPSSDHFLGVQEFDPDPSDDTEPGADYA